MLFTRDSFHRGYVEIAEKCGAGWSVNPVARARYITLFMPFKNLPIYICVVKSSLESLLVVPVLRLTVLSCLLREILLLLE